MPTQCGQFPKLAKNVTALRTPGLQQLHEGESQCCREDWHSDYDADKLLRGVTAGPEAKRMHVKRLLLHAAQHAAQACMSEVSIACQMHAQQDRALHGSVHAQQGAAAY